MKGKETASDVLVDTLIEWGVDIIFGLPGDGINGIIEALRTRQDRIRFVVARHEEAAAFMACAYAKWTGRLGCCLATTGPGGVHLLNGLYDAKFDRAPVLAITGLPYHDLDADLDAAGHRSRPAVPGCRRTLDARSWAPAQVAPATTLACRTALARRGVAHLAIPVDVQDQEVEADSRRRGTRRASTPAFAHGAGSPGAGRRGEGGGDPERRARRSRFSPARARRARGCELLQTAELLGAPIAKALLGKAILPDDHPYVTGGVGLPGRPAVAAGVRRLRHAADRRLDLPLHRVPTPSPEQVRGVQIDIDSARIGLRFPVEAGIVGDAAETLQRTQRAARAEGRSPLSSSRRRRGRPTGTGR